MQANREQAAALLALGHTQAETARLVGVAPVTVKRWNRSPEFRAARNRVVEDARALAAQNLMQLQTEAINTLRTLLADNSGGKSVARARAAMWILERTGVADLAERRLPVTPRGVTRQDARALVEDDFI